MLDPPCRGIPTIIGLSGLMLAAACGPDRSLPTAQADLALQATRAAPGIVPFKGRATGSGAVPHDPAVVCTSPTAPASFGVSGTGTHVGLFTARGTACNAVLGVTFPTARVGISGGQATIVAANGDRLVATYGGAAAINLNCTALNELAFEFTVTGGTGRFAGAGGRFVVLATSVPAACGPNHDPPAGAIETWFDGEISSVGSLR